MSNRQPIPTTKTGRSLFRDEDYDSHAEPCEWMLLYSSAVVAIENEAKEQGAAQERQWILSTIDEQTRERAHALGVGSLPDPARAERDRLRATMARWDGSDWATKPKNARIVTLLAHHLDEWPQS